jgi:hypothetical protein
MVSPCGICAGQSDTGNRFLPEFFDFPCQYHSAGTTYSYIVCGMNNRPVVGRSSGTA